MTLLRIFLLLSIGIWLYQFLLFMDGKREGMRLKVRKKPRILLPDHWYEKSRRLYFMILTLLIILCFIFIKFKVRGVLW